MNLRNESLKVRNEIIEKIKNELNVNFSYSFNDLYWVKNKEVEVRRLKGGIYNQELYNSYRDKNVMKRYNEIFNEVKKFVESLKYDNFKIELNKIKDNYRFDYERSLNINNNMSYEEYKNERIFNEGCLILKISYNI